MRGAPGEYRMRGLSVTYYAASSCGCVRETNQDAVQLSAGTEPDACCLFALADGMGGYEDGDLAAQSAVSCVANEFHRLHLGTTKMRLRQACEQANLAVCRLREQRGVRMGTTLTAMVIQGRTLTFAHVGDCRLYLLRDGTAHCLTCDHTAVGDMVRWGIITPERVRRHAQRSLLNRCLGLELFTRPDIGQLALRPGDTLVLSSDGVWSVVEDGEFASLNETSTSAEELGHKLIAAAEEHSSDDNMSVIVVRLGSASGAEVSSGHDNRGNSRTRFSLRWKRFDRG